jgi:hypothetical protein
MAPRQTKALARVEAILARNAATAVIFRRGPTRHVRMLKWNLRTDKIQPGQWIDARVHVTRCDLTPDGELVASFVASYRRAPGTWTAISRPPWFTALAVWPKGDTWGGGGLFVSDDHFLLAHDERIRHGVDEFKLLDGFTLPKRFRVRSFNRHSPVVHCEAERARMLLSGWRFVQRAVNAPQPDTAMNYPFERPEIMARPLDSAKRPRFELRRFVDGYGPRRDQDPFRIMRAEVHDLETATSRDLGRIDWADADHKGDVLWSKGGKLFRLAGPGRHGMTLDAEPALVADLNDMSFAAIAAPKRAMKWP